MNSAQHFLIGGAAAVLPDAVLFTFGWRKTWLASSHPLVRAHRFLHSPEGMFVLLAIAYGSHLLADYFTHPHLDSSHEGYQ